MICSVSLIYAEEGDGGYTAAFMQLGLSARAVSMGQAYYAVSDDATAIFYNPAGAAFELNRDVGFAYRVMDLDRKLGYAAITVPVRGEATISVGWIFAGVGDIVERDRLGEPGDELDYSENAISLAFARQFSKIVYVGGTGKYHMSKLATVTTNTVAFDIGAYLKFARGEQLSSNSFIDLLRFGFVVGNLGGSYIWTTGEYWNTRGELGDSRTDDFPILVGGGTSVLMLDEKLLIAADARKYQWHDLTIHAGAEYTVTKALKLRAGVDDWHPTFGGGVEKAFNTYSLQVNYGFSASRAGENSDHLFSIGVVF